MNIKIKKFLFFHTIINNFLKLIYKKKKNINNINKKFFIKKEIKHSLKGKINQLITPPPIIEKKDKIIIGIKLNLLVSNKLLILI